MVRTLSLFLLFVLVPRCFSQSISITTTTAPVDILTINDVDFVHSTTPKWVFTIALAVTPPAPPVQAVMRIALDVALADGQVFSEAVLLETEPFVIDGVRTFTNLDFRTSPLVRTYRMDNRAKRRFEDTALPTGTMPAGSYSFRVEATLVASEQGSRGTFTIVLSNPSLVELLSPLDREVVPNQFPLFQWLFDGPRSTIAVFEKLPAQTNVEEAASGIPHLTAEVTGSSFQYPSAAARLLEPGKTYVWYVEGKKRSAGGTDTPVRSTLRSFSVSAGSGASTVSLLEELERALDPKYKPLFDTIREEGFVPAGTIRLNGTPVSVIDLMRIIRQLRTSPEGVLSVRFE
jgi:hypothetical protein